MSTDSRLPEATLGNTSIDMARWSPAMTTATNEFVQHHPPTVTGGSSEPLWLSVQAAARRWRVCERTVERLVARHPDATLRIGRSLRVDVLAFERALRGAR